MTHDVADLRLLLHVVDAGSITHGPRLAERVPAVFGWAGGSCQIEQAGY